MPVGRQIRRDQRARARPNDHPHLILKLAQQHRQRPGRVRPTRPAPTQPAPPPRSLPRSRSQPYPDHPNPRHPAAPDISAPAARRGHQPAPSTSRVAPPIIGFRRNAPPVACDELRSCRPPAKAPSRLVRLDRRGVSCDGRIRPPHHHLSRRRHHHFRCPPRTAPVDDVQHAADHQQHGRENARPSPVTRLIVNFSFRPSDRRRA